MRTYLIVANQTLASEALTDVIHARLADGPIRAIVVAPRERVGGLLTSNETASHAAAQDRVDEIVARLQALGSEASGEVGDPDPVQAVKDAMREQPVDEIIVSTLPKGLSRWLGEDVPSRLRDAVGVPLTVVSQTEARVKV